MDISHKYPGRQDPRELAVREAEDVSIHTVILITCKLHAMSALYTPICCLSRLSLFQYKMSLKPGRISNEK